MVIIQLREYKWSVIESGIRKFEKFFNLKTNGKLDNETPKEMLTPRCGNKDEKDEKNDLRLLEEDNQFYKCKFKKRKNITHLIRNYQLNRQRSQNDPVINIISIYYDVDIAMTPLILRRTRCINESDQLMDQMIYNLI